MPEISLRSAAADWDAVLDRLGVDWGERAVILGPGADAIAERFLLAGSPPLVASGDTVAVLGGEPPDDDIARATPRSVPLAAGEADVVLAVHAWDGPPTLSAVVSEARRLVRPGGSVMLAELDVAALEASTARQYPMVALRLVAPDAAAALAASCLSRSLLEIELVRAGFAAVGSERVDLTRGGFASRADHAAAVTAGLWRGTATLPADVRERLGAVALALGDGGAVVDCEPWVLVRGFRRP